MNGLLNAKEAIRQGGVPYMEYIGDESGMIRAISEYKDCKFMVNEYSKELRELKHKITTIDKEISAFNKDKNRISPKDEIIENILDYLSKICVVEDSHNINIHCDETIHYTSEFIEFLRKELYRVC